jgi:hypothetical protein
VSKDGEPPIPPELELLVALLLFVAMLLIGVLISQQAWV